MKWCCDIIDRWEKFTVDCGIWSFEKITNEDMSNTTLILHDMRLLTWVNEKREGSEWNKMVFDGK